MKALITKLFKKEKQKKEISTFKAARRALITSIVSLVVCFSMLSGTTFAWFTDSVTSGKNKIEAGYTDFDVKKYDSGSKNYSMEINNDTKVFTEGRWNPGEVKAAYYKIENTGNLDIILNVDLIAKATEGQTETDLSDYMVLKAIISNEDLRPTDATTEKDLKTALKNEAGTNVGVKNFKANLFPAEDSTSTEKQVVEPGQAAYVKVIAYLPDFSITGETRPLIFRDIQNESIIGAKCKFSMTVNAFQIIEDVNITYKTFVWKDNEQDKKLALKQVPVSTTIAGKETTIKVWKEVGSTADKVYAFDQDSLQAAIQSKEANVVLLNDIVVTNWETVDSFSGTIKSYPNKKFTIWGLDNSLINIFSGTIESVIFKNCKAPEPYVVITELLNNERCIYNGILAAKTEGNAVIKNVDVLYSTIATTKVDVTPTENYIGALIGWMNNGATLENCTSTNNSINNIVRYTEPKPQDN